jgi:cation channel sperm-associated protein 2
MLLHFSDLGGAFQLLFQVLTLDSWEDFVNDAKTRMDPFFVYVYILMWVWIGAFIFKNVFVGVMGK